MKNTCLGLATTTNHWNNVIAGDPHPRQAQWAPSFPHEINDIHNFCRCAKIFPALSLHRIVGGREFPQKLPMRNPGLMR
jgi:hypothetical protein